MQRFPQSEKNPTCGLNNFRSFRSTDYINTNLETLTVKSSTNQTAQTQKTKASSGNGRARSCSNGRNKAISPTILPWKSI